MTGSAVNVELSEDISQVSLDREFFNVEPFSILLLQKPSTTIFQ